MRIPFLRCSPTTTATKIEEQSFTPGILVRDRNHPECPPLGLDYAFDFKPSPSKSFYLEDGEWHLKIGCEFVSVDLRDISNCELDLDYHDHRKNSTLAKRKPLTKHNFKFINWPGCDRPKDLRGSTGSYHASESGWNVPIDHPHHLFNFPQGKSGHLLLSTPELIPAKQK